MTPQEVARTDAPAEPSRAAETKTETKTEGGGGVNEYVLDLPPRDSQRLERSAEMAEVVKIVDVEVQARSKYEVSLK